MLGMEEHYSPSTFGDFNRHFWKPNWSFIQIMTFEYDLFLNGINLAKTCKFVSLICL